MMSEKRSAKPKHEKKFENGAEVPDQKRRAIPARRRVPTKFEEFRDMLRTATAVAAQDGYETFEESEDFGIEEDEVQIDAKWETVFDPFVGREITREEASFLDNERRTFERKFGRTKPWHAEVIEKFNRRFGKKPKPKPGREPEAKEDDSHDDEE